MNLDILFEDNHHLVVIKPAGMLTQPDDTSQASLEALAKDYIKHKYQKPGKVFLHAVHRLDKPVSGIVVFAKTSKALSRLNASQREKQWRKVYQAEIEGLLIPSAGELCHYLKHDDYKTLVSPLPKPDYKRSVLKYRVLEESVVEIELDTGRYHQIRAQLAFVGCPIIGDTKYGSRTRLPNEAIALHHSHLSFPHAITGEMQHISAPLNTI